MNNIANESLSVNRFLQKVYLPHRQPVSLHRDLHAHRRRRLLVLSDRLPQDLTQKLSGGVPCFITFQNYFLSLSLGSARLTHEPKIPTGYHPIGATVGTVLKTSIFTLFAVLIAGQGG